MSWSNVSNAVPRGLLFGPLIAVLFLPVGPSPANLIDNAGFEQAGSTNTVAEYWEFGNPDSHGGWWGTAERVDWRSHSGSWEASIQGTWSGAGSNGGWWQEAAASAGQTFEAAGWFWADSTWTADAQGLKIEFYNASASLLSTSPTASTDDVGESWVEKSVQGTAPADTAWARLVVFSDNVGSDGALQADDLSLTLIPEPVSSTLLIVGGSLLALCRRRYGRGKS